MIWDLWVDFNSICPDGTVTTLQRTAKKELSMNETIVVGDYEGNTQDAVVLNWADGYVCVELVSGTFCDGKIS